MNNGFAEASLPPGYKVVSGRVFTLWTDSASRPRLSGMKTGGDSGAMAPSQRQARIGGAWRPKTSLKTCSQGYARKSARKSRAGRGSDRGKPYPNQSCSEAKGAKRIAKRSMPANPSTLDPKGATSPSRNTPHLDNLLHTRLACRHEAGKSTSKTSQSRTHCDCGRKFPADYQRPRI